MGHMISLTASDGQQVGAFRADPDGTPKAGLVIVQEIFGVNKHIKDVCDGYAKLGYRVVAPALFDRAEPNVDLGYNEETMAKGQALRAQVGSETPIIDIAAAIDEVKSSGKVGVVGYCWGGLLAWIAAQKYDIDCAVGYYGGMINKNLEPKPGCPIMLHFGETDQMIPMEAVEEIRAAYPDIPLYTYADAGHGFNCDLRASYAPEAAKLALERTVPFLSEHLG